jgi:uncharacterized membrane protein
MVRRRRGWVTPEDIVLPRLRRERLPEAMRGLPLRPSAVQAEALRVAAGRGEVRRRDLVAQAGVSAAGAERALAGLERAGVVRREGRGRGVRYVLAQPAGLVEPVVDPTPAADSRAP